MGVRTGLASVLLSLNLLVVSLAPAFFILPAFMTTPMHVSPTRERAILATLASTIRACPVAWFLRRRIW